MFLNRKWFTQEKILFLIGSVFFCFFALWACFFVPLNNDEALPYRLLGWASHPFSFHQLENAFKIFDLTLPFGFRMHRSYLYTGGIVSSFLYQPFFGLFHSSAGQCLYGAFAYLVFVFCSAWLLARSSVLFVLLICFFPFGFTFIHDLGPIKLAFLLFPVGAWLYAKACEAESRYAVLYAFLMAFLLCCGLEDKIFFLIALPSFFFFCLAFQPTATRPFFDVDRLLLIWGIVISVVLIVLCLLLFSRFPDGFSYVAKLAADSAWEYKAATDTDMVPVLFSHNDLIGWGRWFSFVLIWPYYAHRYFDFSLGDEKGKLLFSGLSWFSVVSGMWLLAVWGGALAATLAWSGRNMVKVMTIGRGGWLFISSLVMVVCFACVKGVWAGHHFIFLWLPFIFWLAHLIEGVGEKLKSSLLACFVALNIASVLAIVQTPVLYEVSPERQVIMDYFKQENHGDLAYVSYLDWGGYLLQEIYGAQNEVVSTFHHPDPFAHDYAAARDMGRTLYVVCRVGFDTRWERKVHLEQRCTKEGLENILYSFVHIPLTATNMLPELQIWKLYRIEDAPHHSVGTEKLHDK